MSGKMLAAFKVRNTGGWNNKIQLSAAIEPIQERTDIVLVFRNPDACVGYCDLKTFLVRQLLNRQADFALLGKLDGIGNKIRKDLFD